MARIRSLHPGQWTDEAFVSCTPMARLFAIAVRNLADDQGVFEWKPLGLKMQIFPADNVDIRELLAELSATDQVREFDASGKRFGAIRNFRKWQRPEKPKTVHPLPDHLRPYVGLSPIDVSQSGGGSPTEGASDGGGSATDQRQEPSGLPLVAEQSPTGSRMSPQRKEEGEKEEGEKEEDVDQSFASLTPPSSRAAPRKRVGLSKAEIDDAFTTWWVNYPRKEAPGRARKAFEVAVKKVGGDTSVLICGLLERLDRFDHRDGGKWIPLPASWLNAERWADGDDLPNRPLPSNPSLPLH